MTAQAMTPDIVDRFACQAPPSVARAECRICGVVVSGGAVVRDPDETPCWVKKWIEFRRWHGRQAIAAEEAGARWCIRVMYCPAGCRHLQVGAQMLTNNELNGRMVLEPYLIRDRAMVQAFIDAHPEVQGVEQT